MANFIPDEKVPETIEKTLEWYKVNGKKGERIGKTIDRVGIESYMKFMEPVFKSGEPLKTNTKPGWEKV